MQLVAFRLDDELHGLPLDAVDRVVRAVEVSPLPGAPREILGVVNVFGRVIPVLNLRRHGADREIDLSDLFIIVRAPGQSLALWIDEVIGVMDYAEGEIISAQDVLPAAGKVDSMVKTPEGILFIHHLEHLLAPFVQGKSA